MLSDRGRVSRHVGTRAPLHKRGSAKSPGQGAVRHRDRASRWHARIFSRKGRRISRRSREQVKGTNEHSLARTHFAEPDGWRALVNQDSIQTGKSFRYDFLLKQNRTYWMQSHYWLQEQVYNSAPLIIWTPEERAKADRHVVVMLSDFSFTPAEKILNGLKRGMQPAGVKGSSPGKKIEAASSEKMSGSIGRPMPKDVVAQKWDDQKQRLVRTVVQAPEAEIDVKYDALLANRRTLDDPEMISVNAGESILLRLIAASSNQNFYVDTGGLEAELLAVDGKAVQPIKGNFFQLGVAQRLDLKVTIPKEGAYPILAQGEGTNLLCGVVLITKGATVPKLSREA